MFSETFILVAFVVAVGSLVQASVGIGLGLLAAPVLALVAPEFVPGPLLASVFCLTLFVLLRERRAVRLRGLGWALTGRVPGTICGALLVARLAKAHLDLALGGLLLSCVLASAWGEWMKARAERASRSLSAPEARLEQEGTVPVVAGTDGADPGTGLPAPEVSDAPRVLMWLAGALSGISGTASGVGGPPVALVFRRYPAASMRATMGGFFLVGVSLSVTALTAVGEFGAAEIGLTLKLLPAVAVGALLSRWGKDLVDGPWARRLVLVLSGLAALTVLVRGILQLL